MTKLQQVKQKNKKLNFLKNDKKKENKYEKMRKMEKVRETMAGTQLQGARMNETLKDHRNYDTKRIISE